MRIALLFVCSLVISMVSPSLAQSGPLRIEVSPYNGAALADNVTPYNGTGTAGPEGDQDPAIRVVVRLINPGLGKVTVSNVSGTFFAPDGSVLSQDQAPPLEIGSEGSAEAVLYYANPSSRFEYRLTGTVQYEKGGQQYSFPISVDETEAARRRW